MPYLIQFHNFIAALHVSFFDLNPPRVGTVLVDVGHFDVLQLQHLPPRMRLDLAILMSVSIEFDVPEYILHDALAMLLTLDLPGKCFKGFIFSMKLLFSRKNSFFFFFETTMFIYFFFLTPNDFDTK
jgi:hypothetical protein